MKEQSNLEKIHSAQFGACIKKLKAGKALTEKELAFVDEYEGRLQDKKEHRGRPQTMNLPLPVYSTMLRCTTATGIPRDVLMQAKAEGCPGYKYTKVDLAAVLPWLFRKRDKTATETSMGVRTQWETYKGLREKIKYEKETESVISKADVEQGLGEALAELFGTIERVFCSELPPALVGLDEMEVRARCKSEITAAKERLRERFGELAGIQKEV